MELTLPIYVEVRRHEGRPVHYCRPLFFSGAQASDPHLGLAISKLTRKLKQQLDESGKKSLHTELADRAFAPDLETHVLKLTLSLASRQARCKMLFVLFPALGRRIAFTPARPRFERLSAFDLQP